MITELLRCQLFPNCYRNHHAKFEIDRTIEHALINDRGIDTKCGKTSHLKVKIKKIFFKVQLQNRIKKN